MFEETRELCRVLHGLTGSEFSAMATKSEKEAEEAEQLIVELTKFPSEIFAMIHKLHMESDERFAVLRILLQRFEDDYLKKLGIDIKKPILDKKTDNKIADNKDFIQERIRQAAE